MKTPLPFIIVSGLLLLSSLAHAGKPLKVFILAGQSNMVGMGSVATFPAIGMDPKTAYMLKDMQDAEGNPVVCDDVYITWAPKSAEEPARQGKLDVHFGGGKAAQSGPEVRIGPEYTFGIYMHKMLGEPILIIKTAWGGKSLIGQFRPPSAGGDKPTGEYYTMMMAHIKKVLADPKSAYPDYDADAGYELAGFVWFQGYNDYIESAYPLTDKSKGKKSPKDYSEYTRLLGCFIRDIRKELSAPQMPFVTGVFGMNGKGADERIQDFRKAQAATAELPEFKGNVVNVFTENYWPEEIYPLMAKRSALLSAAFELEGEAAEILAQIKQLEAAIDATSKGKKPNKLTGKELGNRKKNIRAAAALRKKLVDAYFSPEDAKLLEVGVSQQGFHYWGSTKFYAQAGKAFAEAIPGIQKSNP